MEYKAVTGKSLRFKGSSATKSGGVKKKKGITAKPVASVKTDTSTIEHEDKTTEHDEHDEVRDTRTAAQRKFDEIKRLREDRQLQKTAGMSHRQRIEAMNTHLSKLSEHNDMPKIGPG